MKCPQLSRCILRSSVEEVKLAVVKRLQVGALRVNVSTALAVIGGLKPLGLPVEDIFPS